MLPSHLALTWDDDDSGRLGAAQSGETGEALPAVEPVGTVGGRPAPAPTAADWGPVVSGPAEPIPTGPGPESDPFVALGPGDAAMDRFGADYLQLLDGRLHAIRRCLDDGDVNGARVAVLSLESSTEMLGGRLLAARLRELRSQIESSATQRNALLSLVEVAAAAFRQQLSAAERE